MTQRRELAVDAVPASSGFMLLRPGESSNVVDFFSRSVDFQSFKACQKSRVFR